MNDEQLMEFDPKQARQQLNDEQLERYNELKKQSLQQDIEEKEKEDNEARAKGLKAVRQDKEDELTVEVRGIKFIADINAKQVQNLMKLSKYEDKSVEDLENETITEIRKEMLDVLADLCLDYDREDFAREFEGKQNIEKENVLEKLISKIKSALGLSSKNEENEDPAGLMTVASFVYEVVEKIEDVHKQKKSKFENGRKKTAPT